MATIGFNVQQSPPDASPARPARRFLRSDDPTLTPAPWNGAIPVAQLRLVVVLDGRPMQADVICPGYAMPAPRELQ